MANSAVVLATFHTEQKSVNGLEVKSLEPQSPLSPQTSPINFLLPENIKNALSQRLTKSIAKIEQERMKLKEEFEKECPDEQKFHFQCLEEFLHAKEKLLEDCYKKMESNDTFPGLLQEYKKTLATIKEKLRTSEEDRLKLRIKENTNKENEAEKKAFYDACMKKIDDVINKTVEEFEKFEIKSAKSLQQAAEKNVKRKFVNRNKKMKFTDKKSKLEIDLVEQDTVLRKKIDTLSRLIDSLSSQPLKGNQHLHAYLLEEKNECDEHGFVPLFYACKIDDFDLAEKLIKQGVKKNIKTDKGFAWYFVIQEETPATKKFLDLLDPDLELLSLKGDNKKNAFNLAAMHGNLTAIKWIMTSFHHNNDFNFTHHAKTALKHAAAKGHAAIVEFLLPDLINANENLLRYLHAALASAFINNRPQIVTIFFNAGIVLSQTDRVALLTPAYNPRKDAILGCFDAVSEANNKAKATHNAAEKDKVITACIDSLFNGTAQLARPSKLMIDTTTPSVSKKMNGGVIIV